MYDIILFDHPDCLLNSIQRNLLDKAGYHVSSLNILTYPWEMRELKRYLDDDSIYNWFHPSAIRTCYDQIKQFLVNPQAAINLLLRHPILIRRPLIKSGKIYVAGFDHEKSIEIFGYNPDLMRDLRQYSNHCPRLLAGLPICSQELKLLKNASAIKCTDGIYHQKNAMNIGLMKKL